MARPKKIKEEAQEAQAENEISAEDSNIIQKENLEARKIYLYRLREEMINEGIDTIGKLDVLLSKVIQELETL